MTATLDLTVTLEEARILAQALDLLASDPGLISDDWPNIEDGQVYETLSLTASGLSSRVHDLINAAMVPTWVDRIDVNGLRAALGQ